MPMKNPPHPGDLIRTEVIEALGLSVSRAAEILKVRRATLSDLLHAKAALTPEMALRIEKAFGPDMNHLLRMQQPNWDPRSMGVGRPGAEVLEEKGRGQIKWLKSGARVWIG